MEETSDPLTHNLRGQTDHYEIHKVISACQLGKRHILEAALVQGLSPNSTDDDGCSLLHWASINNRLDCVKELLAWKADPNLLGGVLESSPLHWAARSGNTTVCAMLVKNGAVCNVRDTQGYTPVHLAIQGSHVPLVAYFLLKFDYAKDVTDNSGMTPAMWCAYRSFAMFPLKFIVKSGADLKLREHLMDNTALHIAAQERNYSAVYELLKGGADVSIRNKQQESPLDIARNNKSAKILDAIEEAARRQGAMRSSCFRKFAVPPYTTYFYFACPSLAMVLAWILFTQLPFALAIIVTLFLFVGTLVLKKIEINDPNYRLLPYGVTLAEASLMVVSWAAYAHWYVPWWAQLLFVISVCSLAFSLTRLATIDPGILRAPKDCHQLFVNEAETGIQHQERYCFSCFVRKREQTKHCAVCDHCVDKFDHHCPWLNTCITRRNLREFMLFILSVVFSSIIYCLATGHYALIEVREHGREQFMIEKSFLVVTICLSGIHAFMLSILFVVQLNQISLDMTTNQRIMRSRARLNHTTSSTDSLIYEQISYATRCHNLLEFCSSNGDSIW